MTASRLDGACFSEEHFTFHVYQYFPRSVFPGVFHAPVSGLYLLRVYARTAGDDGYIFIKKNDDVVCRTGVTLGNSGADNLGHDTGICTGITKLIPEDSVRVTGDSGYPARIQANDSGFIGHLIQPYC